MNGLTKFGTHLSNFYLLWQGLTSARQVVSGGAEVTEWYNVSYS